MGRKKRVSVILENGMVIEDLPIAKLTIDMETLQRKIRTEMDFTRRDLLKQVFKLNKKKL